MTNLDNTLIELFGKCSNKELEKIIKSKKFYINGNSYLLELYLSNGVDKIYKQYRYITNKPIKYSFIIRNYTERVDYKPLTLEHIQKAISNRQLAQIDLFDIIYKKAIYFYGEENVDKQPEQKIVTILFPEITITNSAGLSHTMFDIYIQIQVDPFPYLYKIIRGTLTSSEIRNEYLFSHASTSNNKYSATKFCYGSENNPVRDLIGFSDKLSLFKNIEQWLLSIKLYLEWESLEGSPYRCISDVINDTNFYSDDYLQINIKSTATKNYLKAVINNLSGLSYKHANNKIELTSSTKEEIKYILSKIVSSTEMTYVINGRAVRKSTDQTYSKIKDDFYKVGVVNFKENWVELNVIDTDKEVNLQQQVHPQLLKLVENKILETIQTILLNEFKHRN